ncbi:MAG: hypothetical protein WKF94_09085 [Solirubrobacteraceae bacterium]
MNSLSRGAAAGLVGTAVMTGFQRFVEMPLTGRSDSFAPAELAERLLPWKPKSDTGRTRLNYVMHFALGTGWGATRAALSRTGLSGQPAVAATFAVMYPIDVVTATLLGVYRPKEWTAKETAIDVVDKLVQAQATGMVYDRLS